jgi:hypothetical protein
MVEFERQRYEQHSRVAAILNRRVDEDARYWERLADKAEQNWRGCAAMQARIITALKKRGVAKTPSCEGPKVKE